MTDITDIALSDVVQLSNITLADAVQMSQDAYRVLTARGSVGAVTSAVTSEALESLNYRISDHMAIGRFMEALEHAGDALFAALNIAQSYGLVPGALDRVKG